MTATISNMIDLGTKAPDFNLPDTLSGKTVQLHKLPSKKVTLIMFICNHCPYVKHLIHEIVKVGKDFQHEDVQIFAISSNDVENYPDDSPEKMQEWGSGLEFPFPYLYDETQEVAKAYQAACTPDFYVFDKDLTLAYRGQFDDSRPRNAEPINGKDIRKVIQNLLNDQPVDEDQKPSIGCNIKWKAE